MGKPRPYRKYVFKVGGQINHGGITTDLERREQEHRQKWPSGKIKQIGGPVTEESARKWEKDHGYA